MPLKVLIVDDEQPARERLRQLLEDFDGFDVCGEAANGRDAVAKAHGADIVLLDIRMPDMDGIEAARHINELEDPPAIIFATAYDEYAIEAFDARALGYVLKPVRRQRLAVALEQAERLAGPMMDELRRSLPSVRQHLCARSHGELKLIPLDSVWYCAADQKYVNVHHDDGENLIDDTLKSLEEEFPQDFVRIHRSAIVKVTRIARIERQEDGRNVVVLRGQSNDNALVVSRRHLGDVKRRLKGEL
jgi:two-component system response regulator AlgR